MATPNNNPAPTTDYATAYKEVAPQFALSSKILAQQGAQNLTDRKTALTQLGQDRTTNLSSIEQAKVNAFKGFGETANARGMLFSGYQPYEQGQYKTNTYNPNVDKVNTGYKRGVQDTNSTFKNNNLSLKQKIAQLNQDRANTANSLVLDTRSAQQAAADRAASQAKSDASAANSLLPINVSQANLTRGIRLGLNSVKGSDGHTSPESLAGAFITWQRAGLPASSFWKNFQGDWNSNQKSYKTQFYYYVNNPKKIKSVAL